MKIKIGDIINAKLGSNQVHKLYKGSTLIYNYKDMSNLFGYSLYYDTENDPYLSREMFPYFYDAYYNSSNVLVKNQLDSYITLTTKYGTTETFTIDKHENTIPENISRYRLSEIKYIDARTEDKYWFKRPIINNNYGTGHKIIEFPDFMKNNVIELEADLYGLKDYENLFKDFIKLEKVKYLKYSHSMYLIDPRFANYDSISAKNMFSGCVNLKKLHLGSFKVFNIHSMESMFENCKSLEYLDLSNWNHHIDEDETKYSQLNNASKMFNGCTSLKELRLSDSMLVGIYDISFMFNGCKSLEYLDLGLSKYEIDPSKIQGMFNFCKSLKEIDLSNLYTDSITDMSLLFCDCESLENVNLSNFDTSNVEDMHMMFYNCISLKDLHLDNFVVNENVNTENMMTNITCDVYINEYEFLKTEEQCDYDGLFNRGLLTLLLEYEAKDYKEDYDYGSFLNSNPEFKHDGTFYKTKTKIIDSSLNISNVLIYSDGNLTSLSFKDCINVTKVNHIDFEKITNITSLFESCTSLEEINISDYSKLKPGRGSRTFYGCTNLRDITINNLDLSDIDNINYGITEMFSNCNKLQYVVFNNCNFSNVTNMSYMFNNCRELINVSFNNCIYNIEYEDRTLNMSYMFNNCSKLLSADLSLFKGNYDISLSYIFYNCASLTNIILPKSNTINRNIYFNYAFYGCSLINSINFINLGKNIFAGNNAFYDCNSIELIDLSNFLIVGTLKETFAYCENLKRIIFSSKNNSVTNFNSTFTNCKSLEYINLDNFDVSNCDDFSQMFYDAELSCDLNLTSFEINSSANTIKMLEFSNHGHKNVFITDSFNRTEGECWYCCEFKTFYLASIYKFNKLSDANYVPDSVKNSRYVTKDNILDNNIIERKLYLLDEDINNLTFEVNPITESGTIKYICPVISIDYIKIKSDRISLENMFKNCNSLEYINIDNKLSNITNYNSCFYNCSSLESLYLNKISIQENCNTEYMFYNVDSNCKICINPFIFLKTELDCYFNGEFYRLDTLAADYTFYTKNYFENHSIKGYTQSFYDYFYKYNPIETDDNIFSIIDNEIYNGEKINRKIYVSKNSKILSVQFGLFEDKSGSGNYTNDPEEKYPAIYNKILSEVNYIEVTKNIKSLFCLFVGCVSLENFYGENWDTSNVTDMRSMFDNCSSLWKLDLSNWDTSNVTSMRFMFDNCSSLWKLDLSNWDTSKVTDMKFMFYDCSLLESLDLSSFNTENVHDMGQMFKNCSSLESLNLSSFNTENVKYIAEMFYNCSSLKSLDLSSFNTENVHDMGQMFERCSSLTSLDLSSFNTENVYRMVNMFYKCSSLESLDLSSFTVKNSFNTNYMLDGVNCNVIIDPNKFLKTEAECNYTGYFVRIKK